MPEMRDDLSRGLICAWGLRLTVIMAPDVYTHGHHESVLRSHSRRTAENSAAYLLPHLRPGQRLLDVGCGPGTITTGLARRVAPGRVVAIDVVPGVLEQARQLVVEHGNVSFETGDVYSLDFEDGAFDVVHAHQVLQHLTDPVAALHEMRRVTRSGGLVAVRDGDYGAMTWYPSSEGLELWSAVYHRVTAANGAQADAGRRLLAWAIEAGFEQIVPTVGVWCFATPEDREWWAGTWSERVVHSAFAEQAERYGFATRSDLELMRDAWREWGSAPDGWFAVVHGELLATA